MDISKLNMSIIIPCLNESENISYIVQHLLKVLDNNDYNAEIIFIDDGSTDNTFDVICKHIHKDQRIKCFRHIFNKGIAESWITGVENSNNDFIIILDADLQYDPNDITQLVNQYIDGNYDIVQGIRIKRKDFSYLRIILSQLFSHILCIIFNINLKDIKSGFLITKKEIFMKILTFKSNYNFFQHLIIIVAIYLCYTVKQIPVTFHKRYKGESTIHFPLIFALKSILEIPKAWLQFKK